MNIHKTTLPGLLLISLDVFEDNRGNFREVYQAEKFEELGFPKFTPVQQNVSYNLHGTTRGIHCEPWEKLIHVAYGEVIAAIVDVREHEKTFGTFETFTLNSTNALYVPRGLGNSFQVLSEFAVYSYLVNEHWKEGVIYPQIFFRDKELNIPWPIPETEQVASAKDLANPGFEEYKASLRR